MFKKLKNKVHVTEKFYSTCLNNFDNFKQYLSRSSRLIKQIKNKLVLLDS